MFNSLTGKLVALSVMSALVMAIASLAVVKLSHVRFHQESAQKLNRGLAQGIIDERLLTQEDPGSFTGLLALLDRLARINADIDPYLLDSAGVVLASSGKTPTVERTVVDMEPVHRFLAGQDRLPILGDDPAVRAGKEVFSAGKVSVPGHPESYLYLVLRAEERGGIVRDVERDYALREALVLMAAEVMIMLIASWIIFGIITRPLRTLTTAMEQFKRDGFRSTVEPMLSRSTASADEVGRLASTFAAMVARIKDQFRALEQADHDRRELIASVSHDLRTPLQTMRMHLETVKLKEATLSRADRARYLDIALNQNGHLTELVSELFELAKLDAHEVQPVMEPFVLDDLVQDVVQQLELRATEKSIWLKLDLPAEPTVVTGDIGMIERVLKNLLDNALRYTPAGGVVEARATRERDNVRIDISDTGPGVAAEDLPRVFDRFFRGEKDRSVSSGNAGLGLAIAKRIIELHDGRIEASSMRGVRTTFSFWLRIATTPSTVSEPPPRDPVPLQRSASSMAPPRS
jgi:two-component system, OmpR family, sensor kinase